MCDLSKCKGACCVEGDDGAPLTEEEIHWIEEDLDSIKPYMRKEGMEAVDRDGVYYMDADDDEPNDDGLINVNKSNRLINRNKKPRDG